MSTRIVNPNNQNSSKLPEMIICTYKSLELPKGVVQMILPEDTDEPTGFNKIMRTQQANIYGFLSRTDSFVDNKGIDKILNTFRKYPLINFVYADLIFSNGQKLCLPSYPSIRTISRYKAPLFFRQSKELFTSNDLYFHNMILNLVNTSIGYHMADYIFQV